MGERVWDISPPLPEQAAARNIKPVSPSHNLEGDRLIPCKAGSLQRDIGHAGLILIAPRVEAPVGSTRGFFPLCFRGQALSRPQGIGQSLPPGDLRHRQRTLPLRKPSVGPM